MQADTLQEMQGLQEKLSAAKAACRAWFSNLNLFEIRAQGSSESFGGLLRVQGCRGIQEPTLTSYPSYTES